MARLSQEVKAQKFDYKFVHVNQDGQKRSVRQRNRCLQCGRSRAFLRKFQVCRICFRSLALRGEIPGVTKASW